MQYRKELRAYKDMEVTYRELASALLRWGYRNASDDRYFRYINDEYASEIILARPRQNEDEIVHKAYFAALSQNMEWKGVLDDMDDLAKMIERDREIAQAATA